VSPRSIASVFQGFIDLGMGRKNRIDRVIVSLTCYCLGYLELSKWCNFCERLFLSNLWWIKWNFQRGSDIWLKTLVTHAPSMSGRSDRSCVGANSGSWAAGYGFRCLLVVIDLFFACLLFYSFISPLCQVSWFKCSYVFLRFFHSCF
jgi:hypothetical protein